jgi:hypothetical protein
MKNKKTVNQSPRIAFSFCCGQLCALNVYRGYNLVIRSLNGRQCCNRDERLSSGSCHWNGNESTPQGQCRRSHEVLRK